MVQEQYVSFETAKLLKEKGFDGECETSYYISNKGCENATSIGDFTKVRPWRDALIAAPTQQMAVKWLREVHNIHIMIQIGWYTGAYKWNADICKYKMVIPPVDAFDYVKDFKRDSYEEAVEEAIKYCLENLI